MVVMAFVVVVVVMVVVWWRDLGSVQWAQGTSWWP
jgi:hypothetical protein